MQGWGYYGFVEVCIYVLPRSWDDDDDGDSDDENAIACRPMAEASTASYNIIANEKDVIHLVIRLRLRSYVFCLHN